ncbi:MAG: BREX-6 system phosphatase PglZ [Byssovorax sp.]
MSGIVSACLEAEVTKRVASQGIVVWLDKDGQYSGFVDELIQRRAAGDYPFAVRGYRGSFLELMLGLESNGNGLDPEPLLIHLPGYGTGASVISTPLLELYKAGTQFIKALPTLVTEAAAGRVTPAELSAFLDAPALALAGADAWLAEDRGTATAGFAAQLEARGLTGVIDSLFELEKKNQALRLAIPTTAAGDLAGYFLRHTGMDEAWLLHARGKTASLSVEEIRDAWASYLLVVEYVTDLAREPTTAPLRRILDLSKPLRERCLDLVKHFRAQHPEAYAGMADDTERHLGVDKESAKAEDLGKIDTFRFEEEKMREAALVAAHEGRWSQTLTWAKQRSGVAFWVDRDLRLRWEWTLLEHAAAVGVAIEKVGAPPGPAKDLADAVDYYSHKAYEVDAAHRKFEQRVYATPQLSLLKRNEMLEVFDRVRETYRSWADDLGRSFTQICRRHGALPDESLQQRKIFDSVVAPLAAETEKVVFFMIDAFRFEMARDLEAEIKGAGVSVELSARLAELPTITSVGMNVLAPVTTGDKVFPVVTESGFEGFRAGEYTVKSPETRARAIGQKGKGPAVPLYKLAEVRAMSTTELQKRVKAAPSVIVVHSLEFDEAGEKGFGPATFETTLQHIREAWLHLSQAGVKSFVFTGDHGFLLQDRTVTEYPYGRSSDPDRRYVLEDHDRAEPGMLTVPLSKLSYGVAIEKYLLFREDTGVWKTTRPGAVFVHGGNSLQERVIPVLVVRRQRERGGSDTVFEVHAVALEDNLGRRRLKLKLRLAPNATGALAFTGSSQVTLGLRVKDRPDVTVTIVDVEGTAVVHGGLLRVPTKDEWSTVYFQLDGSAEERVQVEVFHPDGAEKITPHVVTGWFDVTSQQRGPTIPPEKPKIADNVIGIDDEGFRRVFAHIDQFNSVNENELVQILGNPRKVRAFARQFEELVKGVKFRVRIDTAGNMKCYVKEAG